MGLIGCTPKENTPADGTTAPTSGNAGGEKKIIYALEDDPEQMNPTLNTYARASGVLQQMFRGLYKFDNTGALVPALATGYVTDSTNTVYTFTLRSGLKWSDGSPLTAHDFEFGWKLLLNPETAAGGVSDMYVIKSARDYNEGNATADDVGVKALDDLTLEVTLNNITPWFLSQTATTGYMPICKANFDKYGLDWAKSADTYVSSGAFMLKSINSKDKVAMVKNPYYYAADQVKIDAVEFMIIPDPETQTIAFENGDLSLIGSPTYQTLAKYEGTTQLNAFPRIGVRQLDFNTTDTVHPEFQDARVRQALSAAIDRKSLMDNIIRTNEHPIFGFTPYGQPSLTDPSKDFRDIVGDVFKYDVAAAKQLLADAGFPNGEGFPKFRFVCQSSQLQKDMAQAIQMMWSDNLNIDCEIVTYEKGYWDELSDDNFDVAFCGWTGDYLDPDTNIKIYAIGGNETEPNWNEPDANGEYAATQLEFNEIIEKTRKSADPAEREALFIEAEKYIATIMPTAPLYSYTDYLITQKNLHGVQKNYIGQINFEFAYFD
jgi:oligopeptide transport system substrate-binding protein